MIKIEHYQGKTIGVFGLGKAGAATVTSLLASGAEVFAADDNATSMAKLKESVKDKNLHVCAMASWPFERMDAIVMSPGIPLTHPKPHAVVGLARQHQVPIIGDIELLYQACPDATYITITGTNGKSTTTALIAHILGEAGRMVQMGGNIGVPALSLEPLGKEGIYVIELSSYQLDLVASTRFDVAIWLNISPDHLDRHGSMEGYIHAKQRIFDRQASGDTAILAIDDAYTQAEAARLAEASAAHLVAVSTTEKLGAQPTVTAGILHDPEQSGSFDLREIRSLRGQHNWQNAAVAYVAARALDVKPEVIYQAMQTFGGLAHRMEWLGEKEGIIFVNDSKATNAEAAACALKSYDNIFWIAGGVAKSGGIEPLTPLFEHVTHAYLYGQSAAQFAKTLEGQRPYVIFDTLQEATLAAFNDAKASGIEQAVILLSPAAASFDQFKNFEARGEAFRQIVSTF